jgi:hypothetical protein
VLSSSNHQPSQSLTAAIENFQAAFDNLDGLVLARGAVIYRRGEFEVLHRRPNARGGWRLDSIVTGTLAGLIG